jgi:hypothetical protein
LTVFPNHASLKSMVTYRVYYSYFNPGDYSSGHSCYSSDNLGHVIDFVGERLAARERCDDRFKPTKFVKIEESPIEVSFGTVEDSKLKYIKKQTEEKKLLEEAAAKRTQEEELALLKKLKEKYENS